MIQLDQLPKWAIPVGVGGVAAVVYVVSKRGTGDTRLQPIPVGDFPTEDDGTQPSWLTALTDSITSMITSSNENLTAMITADNASDDAQQAALLETLTGMQAGTLDTVVDMITAQNATNDTNSANLMAILTAFSTGTQEQIDAIMALIQTGPTTGANSIIDGLKKLFSTAFERVPKPFGVAQPNSDITIGDFGAAAPYKVDTGFTYYDTTGQFVTGPFRQFLGNFGGAKTFGRPLSQIFKHDGYDTQVFEHAIMKWIPGSDPKHYNIVVIPVI